ncbi:glycine-rich domain-containing protein [Lysinibacillus sp. NPDC093712]|uniref:glycine-rich domain-containing protein n=1 Tax=Lysinibacillus sp. NPDC093712 TaxID=3390579 RepID=UPI003D037BA8
MSTNTPNYNLEKPNQDEFYDVNVQNGNMDKIDSALKTLAGEVASGVTQEDLTTIDTKLDGINQGVGEIKGKSDQIKQGVDNLNTKQDSLLLKIQNGALKQNIAIFDKPGTYTWKCPDGVTEITLTMFGGGGSGTGSVLNYSNISAQGGQGAAFVTRKPIKVIPGTTYSLVVGSGGSGFTVSSSQNGNSGGASSGFGITCNGGAGANNYSSATLPFGNSPLCNRGTRGNLNSSNSTYYDPKSSNMFGRAGESLLGVNNATCYGGGAGFGDGGNGGDVTTVVPYGAGSGGNVGMDSVKVIKGGDGIIIIEF